MYVFRYILLSFFIGTIALISVMQHDAWTYRMLERHIQKTFKNNLQTSFSGSVTNFSFFGSLLELSGVSVTPLSNEDWSWSAKKITATFSWFHFFTTGVLDVRMKVDEWNMVSGLKDNRLIIVKHLQELFENPTLPVAVDLTSVSMNKSRVKINHQAHSMQGSIYFNSRSYMSSEGLKNTVYILDGDLQVHDNFFLQGLSGSIQIELDSKKPVVKRSKITGNFTIPGLENEQCYINGSWHNNYGRFSLTSSHDICSIDPVIIGKTKGRIISTFPVQLLKLLIPHIFQDIVVEGKCGASIVFDRVGQNGLQGQIVVHDVVYKDQKWSDTIKITLRATKNICSGIVDIRSIYGECVGKYTYDIKKEKGECFFSNTSALTFPFTYWYIDPQKAEVSLTTKKNYVSVQGLCTTMHTVSNQSHTYTIDALHKNTDTFVSGTFDNTLFSYSSEVAKVEDTHGEHKENRTHVFSWYDEKQMPLFECKALHALDDTQASLDGMLSMAAIRLATNTWLGYPLQGAGALKFFGTLDDKKASIRAQLQDGIIRLPKTYNCVDGLRTDVVIDLQSRECRLLDTECHLYIGTIRLKEGRFCFDDNWQSSFVHIPLLIDNCLINVEKNLFASISGALTIEKFSSDYPSCLRGMMLLDRAQVKKDIFSKNLFSNIRSSDTPGTSMPYDFLCDITLQTVKPITISTPQITTDLAVDLHFNNRLIKPDIAGSISVCGGLLEFPYKPLYITRGNILFTPERSYDPTIELIAKNTIKQHDVSLHIAGSASTHHVMANATPSLTDEQIVALLLFGSPNETLSVLMPALIKHNLESLLLGGHKTLEGFLFGGKTSINENKTSIINSYVKKLFKPISLHFVPRFTDQTGRGGIRGTLEIDINDRLRVLLQKNFSLSEDTRFEVEYQLSDDIALRAIRDERCDIGGEIEMRWKF